MRGQMRQASALGVETVLILGEDEVRDGTVAVRNMNTSNQQTQNVSEFLSQIAG